MLSHVGFNSATLNTVASGEITTAPSVQCYKLASAIGLQYYWTFYIERLPLDPYNSSTRQYQSLMESLLSGFFSRLKLPVKISKEKSCKHWDRWLNVLYESWRDLNALKMETHPKTGWLRLLSFTIYLYQLTRTLTVTRILFVNI